MTQPTPIPAILSEAVPPAFMPRPEPAIHALANRIAAADGVISVVLLGSAARGELAMAEVDRRSELFSDLEFLAVTDGRLAGAHRRAITADAERSAEGFGYRSRLFHVDILYRERARLASLPPFIFTYELAANGRTLAGPDLRGEIRPVSLANLDRRNTHEILIKRLWAIAEALPAAWVRGQPLDALTARTLGVVLHRNPLDVTTALLPEVGALLPTYAKRVGYWQDHPDLPFRPSIDAALGHDSGVYLRHCLVERACAAPAADAVAAYRDAITSIVAALAWLEGERAAAPGLFNERPVTRGEWLAFVRQVVRIAYRAGPLAAVRWACGRRKAALARGLIGLHVAQIDHLEGRGDAAEVRLARAAGALAPVAGIVATGSPARVGKSLHALPFAERWLVARALAGRAFWRTVRLGDPDAWRRIARAIAPEEEAV